MCGPLRDDGVSYGDYLEQLTYLIFLKMSDEYSRKPYERETGIPAGFGWTDMNTLTGAELENQYKNTLETLGKQGGIINCGTDSTVKTFFHESFEGDEDLEIEYTACSCGTALF